MARIGRCSRPPSRLGGFPTRGRCTPSPSRSPPTCTIKIGRKWQIVWCCDWCLCGGGGGSTAVVAVAAVGVGAVAAAVVAAVGGIGMVVLQLLLMLVVLLLFAGGGIRWWRWCVADDVGGRVFFVVAVAVDGKEKTCLEPEKRAKKRAYTTGA